MLLDEDEPAQLFPSPIVTPAGTPDIFALWWPTDDGWGLSEAVLAFVVDVDNASRVQILATEPLPPVTDSPLVTPSAQGQGPGTTSASTSRRRWGRARIPRSRLKGSWCRGSMRMSAGGC